MSNPGLGPGNSSNPRPGHSPFPQSSALIRRSPESPPDAENNNNAYTSQYSNNFNRAESRYSTGRNESIFGYYDYERGTRLLTEGPSQPTPQNDRRGSTSKDRTSSIYSEDEDEEEIRDENKQQNQTRQEGPEQQGRYSPPRRPDNGQRRRPRPSSRTTFTFETPRRNRNDRTDDGREQPRVRVHIDATNAGGSWTWGTPSDDDGVAFDFSRGPSASFPGFGTNNNARNQRFGPNIGPTNMFNGFGGFPVNLPFGL